MAGRHFLRKILRVSEGTFYVSANKGTTFTASAATGLPTVGGKCKAVFGREGDNWLAGGSDTTTYGLWHSTDSGASFTKIANVQKADNVSFGKAAPGQAYPAIYIVAQVDGVRGVFRSNDMAATWVRVNDDQHQYGNIGEALSGDPRVYGRVYVGTNGRGIVWGDTAVAVSSASSSAINSVISSSSSSSSKSSSSVVSSTSVASSSVSSSPFKQQCNWYGALYPVCITTTSGWGYENGQSCIAAITCSSQPALYGIVGTSSSASSIALSSSSSSTASSVKSATSSSNVATLGNCQYVVTNEWNTGFTAAVRIANKGDVAINGWNLSWTYTDGTQITGAWSGTLSGTNPYSVTNLDWNKTIQPGQSVEVGVQGNKGTSTSAQVPVVTGAVCN